MATTKKHQRRGAPIAQQQLPRDTEACDALDDAAFL
jgi:hypothetical protein